MSKSQSLPFVRSPYNYDTMAASNESGLRCEDPSLAQQSSKDECDINFILHQVARGVMPETRPGTPQFGDFTMLPGDYHTSLNRIIELQESFAQLPAELRARFDNDPENLLAFVSDERNTDEAIRLGLATARVEELSTGAREHVSRASGSAPVGRSGESRRTPQRAPNPILEGGEGDDE